MPKFLDTPQWYGTIGTTLLEAWEGAGSSGQVLVSNGTGNPPSWADFSTPLRLLYSFSGNGLSFAPDTAVVVDETAQTDQTYWDRGTAWVCIFSVGGDYVWTIGPPVASYIGVYENRGCAPSTISRTGIGDLVGVQGAFSLKRSGMSSLYVYQLQGSFQGATGDTRQSTIYLKAIYYLS